MIEYSSSKLAGVLKGAYFLILWGFLGKNGPLGLAPSKKARLRLDKIPAQEGFSVINPLVNTAIDDLKQNVCRKCLAFWDK